MVTVRPNSRVLFCAFCGKKNSSQRIFIKKCFLFTAGSVCPVKRITTGSRNYLKDVSKVADDARPGAEVAETTVKRLLCCRFRRTGKAMGHVYQCWWTICREINVFMKYHMFYVLYQSVTYLLTLPRSFSTLCCSSSHCPAGNAVGKSTDIFRK
jgi:hypothetical protein